MTAQRRTSVWATIAYAIVALWIVLCLVFGLFTPLAADACTTGSCEPG